MTYTPSQKMTALVDFLEGVPEDNYNQRSWGAVGPCGTYACAMGWGAIALADVLGVRYDPLKEYGIFHDARTGELIGNGLEAACVAFDISFEVARQLFGGNPSTRCEKIAELRRFALELKEREAQ